MSTFDINNSTHAAAYKLAASHFLSSSHEDWEPRRMFAAIESDEDSDDWLTSELDRDQVYPWIGVEASCEDVMLDPWVRLQEYIVGLAMDFVAFAQEQNKFQQMLKPDTNPKFHPNGEYLN